MRVCHLRGQAEYWKKNSLRGFFNKDNEINYNSNHILFLNKVITYWDRNLNISYFRFRKLIRDIVIKNIKSFNYFDYILYNNDECKDFLKNNLNNIVFYQQDDDDIITSLPQHLVPGINIFKFAQLSPKPYGKFLQKFKYDLREEYYVRPHYSRYLHRRHGLDTNHIIINNSNNTIDLIKEKIWQKSHIWYDRTFFKHNIPIFFQKDSFSLHIIHLSSMTSWRNGEKRQLLTEEFFIKCVTAYIKRLQFLYHKNIIPLEMYQSYTDLIDL